MASKPEFEPRQFASRTPDEPTMLHESSGIRTRKDSWAYSYLLSFLIVGIEPYFIISASSTWRGYLTTVSPKTGNTAVCKKTDGTLLNGSRELNTIMFESYELHLSKQLFDPVSRNAQVQNYKFD